MDQASLTPAPAEEAAPSNHHPDVGTAEGQLTTADQASGKKAEDGTGSGMQETASTTSKQNGAMNGNAPEPSHRGLKAKKSNPLLEIDQPDLNRKGSGGSGFATPPGRRSVQFARSPLSNVVDGVEQGEGSGSPGSPKDRKALSLFAKLRSLTSGGESLHSRSQSGYTVGGESIDEQRATFSPGSESERQDYLESPAEFETEDDADGEHSASEDPHSPQFRQEKRKSSWRRDGGAQTAPTTPKMTRDGRPSLFALTSHSSGLTTRPTRPSLMPRRSTMGDVGGSERQGISEDEGRSRLANSSKWRRVQNIRHMSYAGPRKGGPNDPPQRPGALRRALTGIAASGEHADGNPNSPWRLRTERTGTLARARFARIKASMLAIGRSRKRQNARDQAKSAELIAEMMAGAPAALMLFSMFQRDDHDHRRVPILLEQLKVSIREGGQEEVKAGERHPKFRLDLEYGSGLTRMQWTVVRTLRDFGELHGKYRAFAAAQKAQGVLQLKPRDARIKLPKFPMSAFPYLRTIRGMNLSDSESEGEDDDAAGGNSTANEGTASERPGGKKKRQGSIGLMRRKSSFGGQENAGTAQSRKDLWSERQRQKLESYIQQMIRYLMFRAESNRLLRFLELSSLGIRLAAEGSYHGKEGFLNIKYGTGPDFRRAWTPAMVKNRHSEKWFIVRHSYIVCVESPEDINIYDVFLVDSDFKLKTKKSRLGLENQKGQQITNATADSAAHRQHHSLKLFNSERKLKLFARSERQVTQFRESIETAISKTPWSKKNRFDSFAPVRTNVFCQWLVDGRDHMWNVSRAISMAKEVIYIHDWWLSPELYLRRPAAISQKWRLDRLLQRKAREGVKVYIIIYRNINSAIPIDSEHTKFSLLDLHPNVFVQRSPNQIRQGTFFWAHHEKICVVDHTLAFVGGVDLCFGRWDTPQHPLRDDKLTGFEESEFPKDADHCQLWPGKDYSNPRVQDFYNLDKPYEEMYDRGKVPRMPWHDISMQIVGQPARDLTRHFVQRWNYILRQRKPTRPTPFLLPPPDFDPADLDALGLKGTCEVQILRSCCMWSMGTPDRVECSILNAYVKSIQQSDHSVYIENQFFITSTEWENVKIENTIGDALVERIVRAYKNDEAWRAILIIPLMPGFQNTVDSQDGTSVRLIMSCQFRSINRGNHSIFGRLRAEGIEPEDYIQFFSLRSWGKIGPNNALVTEQLYIHAKIMIVDDRVTIIGSANINERSMVGSRDSECAALVRDTDTLWITMAGEPYEVGRFGHTLRMRLMREHLGIDVDHVMDEEAMFQGDEELDENGMPVDESAEDEESPDTHGGVIPPYAQVGKAEQELRMAQVVPAGGSEEQEVDGSGADAQVTGDEFDARNSPDRHITIGPLPSNKTTSSPMKNGDGGAKNAVHDTGNSDLPPIQLIRTSTTQMGLPFVSQLPALPQTDDTDIGGPSLHTFYPSRSATAINPALASMKRPQITDDCMRDPLNDDFYNEIWQTVAENNTAIFRSVFRCMPDSEVKGWKEYKEYSAYAERFSQAQGNATTSASTKPGEQLHRAATPKDVSSPSPGASGPPGIPTSQDRHMALGPIGEARDAETQAERGGLDEKSTMLDPSAAPTDSANRAASSLSRRSGDPRQSDGAFDEKADFSRVTSEPNTFPFPPRVSSGGGNALEKSSGNAAAENPGTGRPHSASIAAPEAAGISSVIGTAPGAPSSAAAALTATATNATTASASTATVAGGSGSVKRRRRGTTKSSRREFSASDDLIGSEDAAELLQMVQGSLVLWPYDWLVKEEQSGNWLYSIDALAPLEIYN